MFVMVCGDDDDDDDTTTDHISCARGVACLHANERIVIADIHRREEINAFDLDFVDENKVLCELFANSFWF